MLKLKSQFFVLLILINLSLFSATFTTTAVPGVWSPIGAPETGDHLIINHNWSSYNFTFADNNVNPTSNGDITVNNGGALKVNSALTISGNTDLIVEATGSFITTGSLVINGAAGTKRFDGYISNAGAVLNGASITGNGTWEFSGSFANHGSINGFTAHPTFSPFSIANPNNPPTPLPVKLLDFRLDFKNDKININWITTLEVNNDYFILLKKNLFGIFEPLAKINGIGNSTVQNKYSFIDENYQSGWNEYLLKQVDYDEKSEYFPIESIFINPKFNIYPNPVKEKLNIELEMNDFLCDYPISLFDSNGKLLESITLKNSFNTIDLSSFTNGFYYLVLNGVSYKLIIEKN